MLRRQQFSLTPENLETSTTVFKEYLFGGISAFSTYFENEYSNFSTLGISRGLSEAKKSQDSVSGTGSLDVLRYGRVLKARGLVGVRGAGIAYDGLYYVQSVRSTLKRGEFKQSFTLTRNGLVSITPKVPV